MSDATISTLLEHRQLVIALGVAAFFVGGALMRLVTQAVGLLSWGEHRVERIVQIALKSEAFEQAGTKIATAIIAPLKGHIDDLTNRDLERKEAVARAHQRIDELQIKIAERLDRLQEQIVSLYRGQK